MPQVEREIRAPSLKKIPSRTHAFQDFATEVVDNITKYVISTAQRDPSHQANRFPIEYSKWETQTSQHPHGG